MKKIKKPIVNVMIILTALLLAVSLTACDKGLKIKTEKNTTKENKSDEKSTGTGTASEDKEEEENPLIPDFTLMSSEGEEVSLSDYAGKVVVLNFWASWCPPCKEEMPDFQKLHDELADSEETVLLMLNQTDGKRETKKKATDYLEKEGLTFPILYDKGEVGVRIFGISSIPTTVVIDKDGRLSDYALGRTKYDVVAKMIEEAK